MNAKHACLKAGCAMSFGNRRYDVGNFVAVLTPYNAQITRKTVGKGPRERKI